MSEEKPMRKKASKKAPVKVAEPVAPAPKRNLSRERIEIMKGKEVAGKMVK